MTITLSKMKIWYLHNMSLYKELTDEEMVQLDRMTSMSSVKKKQPIYLPGDSSRNVYLLKSGRVAVSRLTEIGKEITIKRVKSFVVC